LGHWSQKVLQVLDVPAQADESGKRLSTAPTKRAPAARSDSRREHDSASDLENSSKCCVMANAFQSKETEKDF
jgi:hypothetical protein